ncbi:extracellular solute-binding protein [Paenibacillus piri]|uniref:Extracellular solute-binding protein n=1 Tax=Paenibacillus piri TaxID=2547395 RepID=A0A4R5KF34_9BACL|nr:extracellular solute-binding protein [Paenibacillus piri]TDF94029.1 extracellular solute-binding protein [Paenibacillus piri]
MFSPVNRIWICMLALICMFVAGCGDAADSNKLAVAPNDENGHKPFAIRMFAPNFEAEALKSNNEIVQAIQNYTGAKLSISWIPKSAYDDKVAASIASGDVPQALIIQNDRTQFIIESVRSGFFWEIGPFLKDYKNLSGLDPGILNNISVEGKIYGLYRARDLATGGFIVRKDWLDRLNLKEPRTMEDLYQVMKAFTRNDPDANGKNDTVGLALNKLDIKPATPGGFDLIVSYFGGPNGWEVNADGKFIPDIMTGAYLDALKFFKRLYAENLMNQDFAITSKARELVYKGKTGVFLESKAATVFEGEAKKHHPDALMEPISRIAGPKGERLPAASGYNGVFMFPKASVKTEAQLREILAFFDKLLDPAMQDLFQWGIEGKHYKVENGMYIRTDTKAYLANNDMHQIKLSTLDATIGDVSALEKKLIEQKKANVKIAVPNPAIALYSPTYTEKENVLNTIVNDARTRFIIGDIDEAGWKDAVEQWKKNGGTQVIEEYETAYVKKRGK